MKKIISILILIVAVIGISGCIDTSNETSNSSQTNVSVAKNPLTVEEATKLIKNAENKAGKQSTDIISIELVPGSVKIINSTNAEAYVKYKTKEVRNSDSGGTITYTVEHLTLFTLNEYGTWGMGW